MTDPCTDPARDGARRMTRLRGFRWLPGMRFFQPYPDPMQPFYEWRVYAVRGDLVIFAIEDMGIAPEVVRWTYDEETGWLAHRLTAGVDGEDVHPRVWVPSSLREHPSPKHWTIDLDDRVTQSVLVGEVTRRGLSVVWIRDVLTVFVGTEDGVIQGMPTADVLVRAFEWLEQQRKEKR